MAGPIAAPGPDVAPEVRELSRRLLPEADMLGAQMAERVRVEIPLYADGELVPHEQLIASCCDNTRFVLGQLADAPHVSIDAPRATGTARAEQGVPYAAVLQAFRVGGRFIWELLVERADPEAHDVLLLAAADIWAVSDELSSQVTDAYRTALADKVRRDGQMRAVLVSSLLDGDSAAAEELMESASALHLPRSGEFAVVSAECAAPGAEALADVEGVLRRHNVTGVWRLDHEYHDGLVELRPGFGVQQLVEELTGLARGRVGVSSVFHGLANAPDARRQARLACTAAAPSSRDVVRCDQHPLAVLLAGAPDQAAALAGAVVGRVLELPRDDRAVMMHTVRIWLAADGSSSRAAEQLHLHRNTVRYRLRRFEEMTGRDLAKPVDAAEVFVALECVRILGLDTERATR
ncbi:PucR family transcriptional regulator [Angustibacter sp. McL0619]|uniref:PucR family transcriptional regulator n=1 Tax=Angustibacter sp. McL0619 TaxID=3415676 RepID=UPI003CEC1AAD